MMKIDSIMSITEVSFSLTGVFSIIDLVALNDAYF